MQIRTPREGFVLLPLQNKLPLQIQLDNEQEVLFAACTLVFFENKTGLLCVSEQSLLCLFISEVKQGSQLDIGGKEGAGELVSCNRLTFFTALQYLTGRAVGKIDRGYVGEKLPSR